MTVTPTPRLRFQFAMLASMAEEIRAHGQPRILFGQHARDVGIFVPKPRISDRLGAPPGKLRVAVYSLCNPCGDRPGLQDRVDGVILGRSAATLPADCDPLADWPAQVSECRTRGLSLTDWSDDHNKRSSRHAFHPDSER
jgi:hypothetical protein